MFHHMNGKASGPGAFRPKKMKKHEKAVTCSLLLFVFIDY